MVSLPPLCPTRIPGLIAVLGAGRLIVLAGDLDRQLAQVDAAIAEGLRDPAAVAEALHRLRGTAGTLGLPELAAAIAALEEAVRQPAGGEGPDGVSGAMAHMRACRRTALRCLTALVADGDGQPPGGTNR